LFILKLKPKKLSGLFFLLFSALVPSFSCSAFPLTRRLQLELPCWADDEICFDFG